MAAKVSAELPAFALFSLANNVSEANAVKGVILSHKNVQASRFPASGVFWMLIQMIVSLTPIERCIFFSFNFWDADANFCMVCELCFIQLMFKTHLIPKIIANHASTLLMADLADIKIFWRSSISL